MKIKKDYLKFFLMFIPFFLSLIVFIQTNKVYSNILIIYKFIVFIFICIKYLSAAKLTKFDYSILVYIIIWLITTIVNQQSIINYLKEVVVVVSLLFIIEYSFRQNKQKYMFDVIAHILFYELLINLVCLIVFPNGVWKTVSMYGLEAQYTFLGLKNQVTPIIIFSITVLFIKIYKNNFKFNRFCIIFANIILFNILIMKSATGILGVISIIIFYFIGVKNNKIMNIKTISILCFVLFLAIVVFKIQNLFDFFIVDILHKDLTLSNRVGIWDNTIYMIKESILLGYGHGTLSNVVKDRNAHNFYLQILIQTGILGFLAYVNIFIVSIRKCYFNAHLSSSKIISACLGGFMICCITEVYSQMWLIMLLAFAYYSPLIKFDISK